MSTYRMINTAKKYALLTVFTAAFGAIYEHFSFGVYSNYMIYAFLFPLILGVLPSLYLSGKRYERREMPLFVKVWNIGVGTLTIGSLYAGALEIYGTGSGLTKFYWIAGGIILAAGLSLTILSEKEKGNSKIAHK